VIDGVLLVDKPRGPTSHDVVAVIRRTAGQKRVGHAGTLDPAATGLLVVLLGHATRLADAFSSHDKSYEAVVELGTSTDTGDAEGSVIAQVRVPALDRGAVESAVGSMVGSRSHVPHPYSAVKSGGKPLYRHARQGGEVPQVQPRIVEVRSAELLSIDGARLSVRFDVSKGTYIRVLAEELGDALGLPAHVAALRRMRSGPFELVAAHALADLEAEGPGGLERALVDPLETPMGVARAIVPPSLESDVATGRAISGSDLSWLDDPGDEVLLLGEARPAAGAAETAGDKGPGGRILAWYASAGEGAFRPKAVLVERSVA
jgi:tRNA pseudouridine55 synthase